jgi:hypothetical protein
VVTSTLRWPLPSNGATRRWEDLRSTLKCHATYRRLHAVEPEIRQIEQKKCRSITEDQRADWLFETKGAAEAVGCHPRKFGDWWERTKRKLIELSIAQPGQTAAELAALIATGRSSYASNVNNEIRSRVFIPEQRTWMEIESVARRFPPLAV